MNWFDEIAKNSTAAPPSPKEKRILLVFGLLFFAIGLFMFISMTALPLTEFLGAKDWQQTQGVVISTEDPDKPHYSYSVDRKKYTGDRQSFFSDVDASPVVHASIDDSITVYYDPELPNSSVLSTRLTHGSFVDFLAFIPFAGAGGCIFLYSLLIRPLFQKRQVLLTQEIKKLQEIGGTTLLPLIQKADHLDALDTASENQSKVGQTIFSKGESIQNLILRLIAIPIGFAFFGIFVCGFLGWLFQGGQQALFLGILAAYCLLVATIAAIWIRKALQKLKFPEALIVSITDFDKEEIELGFMGLANDNNLWHLNSLSIISGNPKIFRSKFLCLHDEGEHFHHNLSSPYHLKINSGLAKRVSVWVKLTAQHADGRVVKNKYAIATQRED